MADKVNTGDAREPPAMAVDERLIAMGADVRAVDPHVTESHVDPRVTRVETTADELRAADIVVLLTDYGVLDDDAVAQHCGYALDCRRRLPAADNVEHLSPTAAAPANGRPATISAPTARRRRSTWSG